MTTWLLIIIATAADGSEHQRAAGLLVSAEVCAAAGRGLIAQIESEDPTLSVRAICTPMEGGDA